MPVEGRHPGHPHGPRLAGRRELARRRPRPRDRLPLRAVGDRAQRHRARACARGLRNGLHPDPRADPSPWRRRSAGSSPSSSRRGGRITAIDLNAGEIAWQVPNGDTPDYVKDHPALEGIDVGRTGRPDRGGLLVTSTLLFAGEGGGMYAAFGSGGNKLRAHDKATGAVIAEFELPANQTGLPMTYMHQGPAVHRGGGGGHGGTRASWWRWHSRKVEERMTSPAHISALLRAGAADTVALSAPNRPDLSYGGLRRQADRTVDGLNARGIGRGDRVAIVLPNGPEMASAFVSIAAGAATAPLNPAYRQPEFEFYLEDLGGEGAGARQRATTPRRGQPPPRSACRCWRSRTEDRWPAGHLRLRVHTGGRRRRPERQGRARRCRAGTPHLGDHVAPQDRAAAPRQRVRDRREHPAHARSRGRGPLPERDAALPHPRADGVRAVDAGGGRQRVLRARVQRAQVLRMARGRGSHLVFGGPHDASGRSWRGRRGMRGSSSGCGCGSSGRRRPRCRHV